MGLILHKPQYFSAIILPPTYNRKADEAEFLTNIPTKIEAVLSKETFLFLEVFELKIKRMKNFIWAGIGIISFAVLARIISINLSTKWYNENIRIQSELRQEIHYETTSVVEKIHHENEVKTLTENTKIMQIGMKSNPKEADVF